MFNTEAYKGPVYAHGILLNCFHLSSNALLYNIYIGLYVYMYIYMCVCLYHNWNVIQQRCTQSSSACTCYPVFTCFWNIYIYINIYTYIHNIYIYIHNICVYIIYIYIMYTHILCIYKYIYVVLYLYIYPNWKVLQY